MTDTTQTKTAAATLSRMIRAAYAARDLDQLRALDARVETHYMLGTISTAEMLSLGLLICNGLDLLEA